MRLSTLRLSFDDAKARGHDSKEPDRQTVSTSPPQFLRLLFDDLVVPGHSSLLRFGEPSLEVVSKSGAW